MRGRAAAAAVGARRRSLRRHCGAPAAPAEGAFWERVAASCPLPALNGPVGRRCVRVRPAKMLDLEHRQFTMGEH